MYRNGCENRACPTQRQASLSTAGVWLVFACLKQTKCTPGKNKSSFDFALASPIFASGSKDSANRAQKQSPSLILPRCRLSSLRAAKIRYYFLSIAFFKAFIAISKTERGHPMFKRIYPSPPGPNMLPSLSARCALSRNRLTRFS